MNLLRTVVSWIGRHILLLLIVLVVIVAFQHLRRALVEFNVAQSSVAAIETVVADVRQEWEAGRKGAADRVRDFEAAANETIEQRISEIDRQLIQISNDPAPAIFTVDLGGLRVDADAAKKQALSNAKKELLLREQAFLKAVLSARTTLGDYERRLRDARKELERRRLEHVTAYGALMQNEHAQRGLIANDPFKFHRIPYTPAYETLQQLRKENRVLRQRNLEAHGAYEAQKRIVELMKSVPGRLPPFAVGPDLPDSVAAPLLDAQSLLQSSLKDNWFGGKLAAIRDDMTKALPMAAAIVLGVILTPLAIKTVFYFVLARIASGRPAIALLPQAEGNLEPQGAAGGDASANVSTVSRAVTLDASNELLVHPEYLQSSPHGSSSQTKLILSGRYWLASLAAGLYAITRMRSESPATVVVSSTRDPLSEIGILLLPAGSALVLQPRYLVGVLQPRDKPLRITSHWRLGSLHAWLTLQLRYLVFHGPVKLIVKGCRGVRVERADEGRSINQAATIGFSANLGYASRRSETFFGYLSGKQPLLHDSFAGAEGKYVYQETPHGSGRTGVTGRGLEGVADAMLKVLGI